MKELVLKVSSKSNPNSVAGSIAANLKENESIKIQTIGAGATNQAIKAIAIARGFTAPLGYNLICVPGFSDVKIDDEMKSAIILTVIKN